jgi:hypothetical protein
MEGLALSLSKNIKLFRYGGREMKARNKKPSLF